MTSGVYCHKYVLHIQGFLPLYHNLWITEFGLLTKVSQYASNCALGKC